MSPGSEWRNQAACVGTNPETFFPSAAAGPIYDAQVVAAKAICAGCPVRTECLTEMARIPYGIAGGLTPDERRRTRRPRRISTEPAAVLDAGRVLLAAGRPVREVAHRCGVTERTVARWTARTTSPRTGGTTRAGRGAA